MTTLKQTIYNILLNQPECRDSDKKLIWEVYRYKGLTSGDMIDKNDFFNGPTFEGIRRCRQALQRKELLTSIFADKMLIQPTKQVKETRVKLSKSKGFEFQQGYTFDPTTQTYR